MGSCQDVYEAEVWPRLRSGLELMDLVDQKGFLVPEVVILLLSPGEKVGKEGEQPGLVALQQLEHLPPLARIGHEDLEDMEGLVPAGHGRTSKGMEGHRRAWKDTEGRWKDMGGLVPARAGGVREHACMRHVAAGTWQRSITLAVAGSMKRPFHIRLIRLPKKAAH